jgi:FdhE protein
MTAPGVALNGLKRQRPEWEPWLAVVEEVLHDAAPSAWDAAVPAAATARSPAAPLLAGAALSLERRTVARLFRRLLQTASSSGTVKMRTLKAALDADFDPLALFAASVRQDTAVVSESAAACGVDEEALQAVTALLPVPFLSACNRHWAASMPLGWVNGYCPVCGSWPAFAEVRGIERNRYFRCGRCGGEWHAHVLHCPCCGTSDHNELAALVPEGAATQSVIEACKRCHVYVKAFTTLQGCSPAMVMLEDLASVDLDVAALEQGYTRPQGAGYDLDITVTAANARRGFFAWRA